MNTIYIEGRLVREPDIIWTPSGICVANFQIAENVYAGKNEEGNAQYEPIFHRCVAFGVEAEKIGNDSQRGRIYKIKGTIIPNNYVNKEGKKIYSFKLKAEFIEFGALPKKKAEKQPNKKEQAA